MEQQHEGGEEKVIEELSRQDFLKAAGIAGLGMAGLGAMMSGPASAQEAKEGKKGKYIIVITHGGNNPNRAIWALLMADTIQKKGLGDVNVWMTIEGADLCKKSVPEKIVSPIFSKFGKAMPWRSWTVSGRTGASSASALPAPSISAPRAMRNSTGSSCRAATG